MAIVMIPGPLDSRKRFWRKALERVDRSQSTGYAFVGSWVHARERAELAPGTYVLAYDEAGSHKNWYPVVRLWRVKEDGDLEDVYRYDGRIAERSWALAVRDPIADFVNAAETPPPQESAQAGIPDLSGIPTEVLVAELRRRGVGEVEENRSGSDGND
jgi:hypothetical protein